MESVSQIRKFMLHSLFIVFLLFCPYPLLSQRSQSPVLTNSDVVQMYKAGVPSDIIIAKIKRSPTSFDTSPKALIALKAVRLPNSLIMAMVNAAPARTAKPKVKPCGPAVAGMVPCRGAASSTEKSKPSVPLSPPQVGPLPQFSGHFGAPATSDSSAVQESKSTLNAEDRDAWQPEFDMDGQLFPSIVLELSGSSSRFGTHSPPNYIGDPTGAAGVKVFCWKDDEKVHVGVQIDGLSEQSTLDATLPHLGTYYNIYPAIRYYTAKLERVSESYPTTVEFSVEADGENLGQKTLTVQVHSVNDVPFGIARRSGKSENLGPLFAGFVDENNPGVQTLLKDALNVRAVNQFAGYQGGQQAVEMQVFAIWNVLQRRHMRYSSTATASAQSPWGWVSPTVPEGKVISQTVRFLDQSINDQQANCIDGAVLFASALYKIGIDPLLVILPGHAFVGYFTDAQHLHPQFLETTLVGQGPMPLPLRFGALYQITATASWKGFLNAVRVGNQEFDQEVRFHIGSDPRYMLIDIQKAREAGINPIPRPF